MSHTLEHARTWLTWYGECHDELVDVLTDFLVTHNMVGSGVDPAFYDLVAERAKKAIAKASGE